MKNRIRQLLTKPFVRNVATLASGTAAAQAVSMAFAPLITRLYGPEAFGLQGIFISVLGLLSVVAGLAYPIAMVLPRNDVDAISLGKLSVIIAVIVAGLTTAALYFFGTGALRLLNAEAIATFMYLLPLAMLGSALNSVLGQWLVRKKAFSLTARYTVFTTIVVNVVKAGLGFVLPTAMILIVTTTVGSLFSTALTYLGWRKAVRPQPDAEAAAAETATPMLALARRHSDFPLLRAPQNLINAFSQSLPVLLLASYFGAAAAGQYSIALAMLGIPANLIGNSVMTIFYPRINDAIQNRENPTPLIVKATKAMVATGAIPFLIVVIAGPVIFRLAFGEKWHAAGVYAQWLAPWLFLQYVNRPAVSAIPALRLQGGLLVYELFSTGTKVLALWLGFIVFKSDVAAIALFSTFGVVAYVWLILWVIRRSRTPLAPG